MLAWSILQEPSKCMATICARSLNEIYRARLLQLVITFHGGMQAIAYNWGSFNYYQCIVCHVTMAPAPPKRGRPPPLEPIEPS